MSINIMFKNKTGYDVTFGLYNGVTGQAVAQPVAGHTQTDIQQHVPMGAASVAAWQSANSIFPGGAGPIPAFFKVVPLDNQNILYTISLNDKGIDVNMQKIAVR